MPATETGEGSNDSVRHARTTLSWEKQAEKAGEEVLDRLWKTKA